MRPRFRALLVPIVLVLASALLLPGCGTSGTGGAAPTTEAVSSPNMASPVASGDEVLAQVFAAHKSGVEVEGEGTVQRVLSDDVEGDRHQRFIVDLASGQTILIAHNIDVAPRVPGLEAGDRVSFKGEYEWSEKGGTVHWTHRDPDGSHAAGWIKYKGKTYQ